MATTCAAHVVGDTDKVIDQFSAFVLLLMWKIWVDDVVGKIESIDWIVHETI